MISRKVSVGASIGIIACGAFGVWAAGVSPWNETAIDRAIGLTGAITFVLAGIGLLHRSWSRIPLLGICGVAAVLTMDSTFSAYDPSEMSLFPYTFLNLVIIGMALFGLAIVAIEFEFGRHNPFDA